MVSSFLIFSKQGWTTSLFFLIGVHEVAKSQTRLKHLTHTQSCFTVLHTFLLCSEVNQLCVVVESLSWVLLLVAPWTAACQTSLSSTIFQSLVKLMPIESKRLSSHLILWHPLILLPSIFQSFPASAICIYIYIYCLLDLLPTLASSPLSTSLKSTKLSSLNTSKSY